MRIGWSAQLGVALAQVPRIERFVDRRLHCRAPTAPAIVGGVDLFEHSRGLHGGAGGDRLVGVADRRSAGRPDRRAPGGTRRSGPVRRRARRARRRRRATAASRARRRAHRRRPRPSARARSSRLTSVRSPLSSPVAVGRFGRALAVEVRQQRDPSAPSARRGRARRTRRDRPRAAGRRHRRPWPRSACRPAAGTARWRRRIRRPRPLGSAVGESHTAYAVPDVPAEITASPVRRPTPSAAAMLSPVPGATTAPFHVARPSRRAERPPAATPLQSRSGSIDREHVVDVRARSPATSSPVPEASPRSVVNRPGHPERQVVVRQDDVRDARPTPSGCVRCSHDSFVTVSAATGTLPTAATQAARPASPPPQLARSTSRRRAPTRCRSRASPDGPARSSASSATMPCCWPPTLIAAIGAGAVARRPPAARPSRGRPRKAAHQSPGGCSLTGGVTVGCGADPRRRRGRWRDRGSRPWSTGSTSRSRRRESWADVRPRSGSGPRRRRR